MRPAAPAQWRTPEELAEIAWARSPVVLVNEAHDGVRRCIRTRETGIRIVKKATEVGVRHLAMEALFDRGFTERANRDRRLPEIETGYLGQPEMRALIELALRLGWTLISYEADMARKPEGLDQLSVEATNWREDQQARNLTAALSQLPGGTPVLVWCGNHHLAKNRSGDWLPMGQRLQLLSRAEPFSIDQTLSVDFARPGVRPVGASWAEAFADTLDEQGGTVGFLADEAPAGWPCSDIAGRVPPVDRQRPQMRSAPLIIQPPPASPRR